MRLPGPCTSVGWRRGVLALAMIGVAATVPASIGSGAASSGTHAAAVAGGAGTTADDPEIINQAATLVLAPANDDNFTPPGACGGTTVAPSRCTAAIWIVNGSTSTLDYSTTPCPTSPSLQVQVLTGINNPECTAAAFIPPAAPAPAPQPSPAPKAPAPPPAATSFQTAITGFPGARCIPGDCRLYLTLAQADGDFNAPGLCSGNFDVIAPCMVADFDTTGAVGAATLDQSGTACPPATRASSNEVGVGDIDQSCSANPAFLPATMQLTLPARTTAAPATPPTHGSEVADEAATYVLAPVGDNSFDPPNTCGSFGLDATGRCTAAVLQLNATTASLGYSSSLCEIDIPADIPPCTSAAFQPSMGGTAVSNYPGSVCFGAQPPTPPAVPGQPAPAAPPRPVVDCHLFVVLTPPDGDFNAPGMCTGTTIISAACTLAVVDTSGIDQNGGETLTLPMAPVCLKPPADPSDITASCSSAGWASQSVVVTLPRS